jgi:hypothetical protein
VFVFPFDCFYFSDVNTSNPDKKSIMMYVMCLYQALPHAKVPLVPANGNSSTETTTGSSSASVTETFYFSVILFICVVLKNNLGSF